MSIGESSESTTVHENAPFSQKKNPLPFFILFLVILILSFMAGYYLPTDFDTDLRVLTARGTLLLSTFFNLETFSESATLISIEGKWLDIVSECTASNYLLIFSAAILAWPVSARKKLFGLLAGLPLIILLNLLRIVFLGWVGGNYSQWFDFFHLYLWEGGFALVVVLLWIGWLHLPTDGFQRFIFFKGRETSPFRWFPRIALLLFLIALMVLFSDEYQRVVASGSEWLISSFGFDGISVRSKGLRLMIVISHKQFREVWAGIYYLFPFILLMALFPVFPRRGDRLPALRGVLVRLVSGLLLLTLLQLLFVMVYFLIIAKGGQSWQMVFTDTTARLAPVVVWALIAFRWRRPVDVEEP